jgi:uncharacterized protein (DUF1330 family)
MPKGYVIFTEDVRDEAGMVPYGEKSFPTMMKAGGRVLAVAGAPQVVEGEWNGTRTVVLEFDSVEAARTWYDSPGYQECIPLRKAAADCNVVIVSGFEMPGD